MPGLGIPANAGFTMALLRASRPSVDEQAPLQTPPDESRGGLCACVWRFFSCCAGEDVTELPQERNVYSPPPPAG